MSAIGNLVFKPATELRQLLANGSLKPTELLEATLQQISNFNQQINAVVTLAEQAWDEARKLEKQVAGGKPPGLLYGLPIGIKDVTPTAGVRTTFGSPIYADNVPRQDALVVQRLKQAGGIVVGKTNTPEFAAGGNTFNEVFGKTRNPWNPKLSAGGSTGGGAAALATGMIALAEGTDLGGSLRIPASFCGVVGLRPTPGLVPTFPSDYLWDTLQSTGPMARTVDDVALMLQALSGASPLVPIAPPHTARDFVAAVREGVTIGHRIAYCSDLARIGINADIERACRSAAFEMVQAGLEVEEQEIDLSFGREAFLALRGYWMVAHHYGRLEHLEKFGPNLSGNIKAGLKLTIAELAVAEQTRGRIWQWFHEFFQTHDYLLTPCMAVPPFLVEQNYPGSIAGRKMKTYIDWIAPTFLLSLTSLPVCCVPCGLDESGLPVGLQIVGPPQGEEKVLALAKLVQDACPIGHPDLSALLQTRP